MTTITTIVSFVFRIFFSTQFSITATIKSGTSSGQITKFLRGNKKKTEPLCLYNVFLDAVNDIVLREKGT